MDNNIATLVEKARKNDIQAINELYAMTNNKCFAIAKTLMKNESDVKDVIQDTYLKAFQNLDKLNEPEKFESWLNKILYNTCRNKFKSDKRQEVEDFESYKLEKEVLEKEDPDLNINPDKYLKYENDRNVVLDIIEELPYEQRIALVMQYYDGYKIQDIAEITGVNENTVKSRLGYAKKHLKKRIDEYETSFGKDRYRLFQAKNTKKRKKSLLEKLFRKKRK